MINKSVIDTLYMSTEGRIICAQYRGPVPSVQLSLHDCQVSTEGRIICAQYRGPVPSVRLSLHDCEMRHV